MVFQFTEAAKQEHLRWVVGYVAGRLAIQDWEWLTAKELVNQIETMNADIHDKLHAYVASYEAWFAGNTDIDTGNACKDIVSLILERDAMRKALIQSLSSPMTAPAK